MSELIPIKLIKQDSRLQPRAKMDTGIIDEYTEAMRAEAIFPPVEVFKVEEDYYLVDGYHRFMAAQGAGMKKIHANVRTGTLRAAILCSAGVNSAHGIRRTNEDKKRAVLTLLRDKEWAAWSNVQIASICKVSDEFVRKVRADFQTEEKPSPSVSSNVGKIPSKKVKVERAGKVYKMKTGNIGKNQKSPAEQAANSSATPNSSPAAAPVSEFVTGTQIRDGTAPDPAACQPSLAAQAAGAVPPVPAAHNPPPCKGGGGCTRGKFVANDKTGRGAVCGAIGAPINQLPGNMCPYDAKLERKTPTVDTGFETGNGKKDFVTPKVPAAPSVLKDRTLTITFPPDEWEILKNVQRAGEADGFEAAVHVIVRGAGGA